MSDIGPYGVTQHADAAMVTADQLAGTRIESTRENAGTPGVGPALHSTAPYVPPPDKTRKGIHGCRGKDGTCSAHAMRGGDWCFFHSQEAG